MSRISKIAIFWMLVLILGGCGASNLTDEDGEGDSLADRMLKADTSFKSDYSLKATFEVNGAPMSASIMQFVWKNANDEVMQRHTGHVLIDTQQDWLDIYAENLPLNFALLDIGIEDFYMGGGDGRGEEDDETSMGDEYDYGGGDGRGIVLPHLIIDRNGYAPWMDVVIKITVSEYSAPTNEKERQELVLEIIDGLEVWEGDELVGTGNVEKTLLSLTQRAARATGVFKCYDDEGIRVRCEDSGQDGEFSEGFSIENEKDEHFRDPVTGLIWENKHIDGSIDIEYTYDGAQAFCEEKGMRIPKLAEFRTIIDFGYSNSLFATPISGGSDMHWTSDAYSETEMRVIDGGSGFVKTLPRENYVGMILCVDDSEVGPDSEKLKAAFDPESGLAWYDSKQEMTWQESLDFCNSLVTNDRDTWRLANIAELSLLIGNKSGLIDTGLNYWSSTSYMGHDHQDKAWLLLGDIWGTDDKHEMHGVACIRSTM